jgi:hypothetical protein
MDANVGKRLVAWAITAMFVLPAGCEPSTGPSTPPVTLEEEPSGVSVEYVRTQEILTPLPLRVRLPSKYGAERVFVFFRTWGSSGWEYIELARRGQTWTGSISCRDVSTITGDTRYFFVALNAQAEEVVGSGWPEWPHVATVVRSLPEGPQSIPNMGVVRCHDPADCPPDFLGCPAYALVRPPCSRAGECRSGAVCAWDGYCDSPPANVLIADFGQTDEELLDAAVSRLTRRPYHARANVVATSSKPSSVSLMSGSDPFPVGSR